MAKSRTTRARRHTDRHGTTAPEVPESAMCATRRHAQCRGLVVSLLYPQDTACACQCHGLPVPAAWKGAAA